VTLHIFLKGRLITWALSYVQQYVSDLAQCLCKVVLSYDQQLVSEIAHFSERQFITSCPMNQDVSDIPHLSKRHSHLSHISYDEQRVSDIF
jgi:hypothetical protein